MGRFRLCLAAIAVALLSWPTAIQGQRFPTRSDDLKALRSDRVRVIVQADDNGLSGVGRRHSRGLRRRLGGAVAMEVSKAEFDALARDGSVSHISKDLPVVADMAITNR